MKRPTASTPYPNAVEAEKSILSSCLQQPEMLVDLLEAGITPESFYLPAHGTLFHVVRELYEKDKPIELVSLTQLLADRDLLANIGGPSELTSVYTYAPTAAHFEHHLSQVRDRAMRREAIRWANQVEEAAYDIDSDLHGLLTKPVDEILSRTPAAKEIVTGKDAVTEWLDHFQGEMEGKADDSVSCGVDLLDDLCGIPSPGLTFISAFPGTGKTAMMIQVACHMLLKNTSARVLIFSLEMTARQLIQRAMIHLCGFKDPAVLMDPHNTPPTREELDKIRWAAGILAQDRFIIDPTAGIHIDQVVARTKMHLRRGKLAMVALDYVQRCRASVGKDGSVEQTMTKVSAGLQRIMKMAQCPVLALSQLTDDGRRVKMKYAESLNEDADMHLRILKDRNEPDVTGVKIEKDRHFGCEFEVLPIKFNKQKQKFAA